MAREVWTDECVHGSHIVFSRFWKCSVLLVGKTVGLRPNIVTNACPLWATVEAGDYNHIKVKLHCI